MSLKILLLCDRPVNQASTICDHISAIIQYSQYEVHEINPVKARCLSQEVVDNYDIIIVHYSIIIVSDNYLHPVDRFWLSNFLGVKILFIQDEYRWINQTVSCIKAIGFDLVYTCVPKEEIPKVYPVNELQSTKFINTLTGFVPEHLLEGKYVGILEPFSNRKIDFFYRGRYVPAWYGKLALEKYFISNDFKQHVKGYNLEIDISSKVFDRVYGDKWVEKLKSAKATLGTESGASVFDFTGDIRKQVEKYELAYPLSDYNSLEQRFFKNLDGKIRYNQVSPRIFEATALKTLLVLYEGTYSNVIKPWRHYLPLKKDYSNIRQILDVMKNNSKCQKIIDCAYEEVAQNPEYSYKMFVAKLDEDIKNCIKKRNITKSRINHQCGNTYLNSLDYIGLIRYFNKTCSRICKVFNLIIIKYYKINLTINEFLSSKTSNANKMNLLSLFKEIVKRVIGALNFGRDMFFSVFCRLFQFLSSYLFFNSFFEHTSLSNKSSLVLCMNNNFSCLGDETSSRKIKRYNILNIVKYKHVVYCQKCSWFFRGYRV